MTRAGWQRLVRELKRCAEEQPGSPVRIKWLDDDRKVIGESVFDGKSKLRRIS